MREGAPESGLCSLIRVQFPLLFALKPSSGLGKARL